MKDGCFFFWKKEDDEYILHLRKRINLECEYILRLYLDGNGVIICSFDERTEIRYFKINESLRAGLVAELSERVDQIISHQERVCEDDRCFCPFHCLYGLKWKYKDAYDRLRDGNTYEDCDYYNDEYESETVCKLLNAPEVSGIWMKLH